MNVMEARQSKNALEGLENLSTDALHISQIGLVLAVYLDVKPVSDITVQAREPLELAEKTAQVRKALEQLGLKFQERYERLDDRRTTDKKDLMHFSVSKKEDALHVPPSFLDPDLSAEQKAAMHLAYGRSLGFPESAVKAFANGETHSMFDLVNHITPEEYAFLYFAPSKTHLQEELDFAHAFAERAKAASPKLYRALVDDTIELYKRVHGKGYEA